MLYIILLCAPHRERGKWSLNIAATQSCVFGSADTGEPPALTYEIELAITADSCSYC